jgi:hypothetical protein
MHSWTGDTPSNLDQTYTARISGLRALWPYRPRFRYAHPGYRFDVCAPAYLAADTDLPLARHRTSLPLIRASGIHTALVPALW